MLLFDEADARSGKRHQASDSYGRHVNIEVMALT